MTHPAFVFSQDARLYDQNRARQARAFRKAHLGKCTFVHERAGKQGRSQQRGANAQPNVNEDMDLDSLEANLSPMNPDSRIEIDFENRSAPHSTVNTDLSGWRSSHPHEPHLSSAGQSDIAGKHIEQTCFYSIRTHAYLLMFSYCTDDKPDKLINRRGVLAVHTDLSGLQPSQPHEPHLASARQSDIPGKHIAQTCFYSHKHVYLFSHIAKKCTDDKLVRQINWYDDKLVD